MNFKKYTHEDVKKLHKEHIEQISFSDLQKSKPRALNSSLDEYVPSSEKPWDHRRIKHLKRRMEFGYNQIELNVTQNQNPATYIDTVFSNANNAAHPSNPYWYNYTPPYGGTEQDIMQYFENNFNYYQGYIRSWLDLMRVHSFREKMVLFWHNHFVTEIGAYELAPLAARYISLLRTHALGNFKDFVSAIGLDQAMLVYLNGNQNRVDEPNENYARELLELFTMGVGNYTQEDITEIARALTGYEVIYDDFSIRFRQFSHDHGEKTIFNRTGNFGYYDVIQIIFEEKAQEIANFICTKLYKHFVYEVPNQSIIDGLAQTFIDSDWEIEPVLKQLFKSEHFFDDEIIGALYKSPIDLLMNIYSEMNKGPQGDFLTYEHWVLFDMNQFPLGPPNVAGWPGFRNWLSTTYLPRRWNISEWEIWNNGADMIALANGMSDPNNPYQLAYDIADYLLAVPLPESERAQLPGVLLGSIPDYEWSLDREGADYRILNLILHIRKLPEYQHL